MFLGLLFKGAYTPGDFTDLQHDRIRYTEEQIFDNPSSLKELNKPVQAGACILGHQNPTIVPKMQSNLCVGMTVISTRSCDTSIGEDCAQSCEITGTPSVGLTKENYDLNGCIPYNFSVNEEMCDNVAQWDDLLAREKCKAMVEVELELTKRLVTFVAANADTPDLTDISFDVPYTTNANCIQIASSAWDASLFGELDYLLEQMDIITPLYITGKNFHTQNFLSQYKNQTCCNNSDAILKSNDFNICFDTRNIDSTLGGRYTLVMDQDSILFWNSYRHPSLTPLKQTGDLYEWREALPRLKYGAKIQSPGNLDYNVPKEQATAARKPMGSGNVPIWVDMAMQRKCVVVNDIRTYVRCYEMRLRYALHPGICDCNDNKGIIKLLNDCSSCAV